MAANTRIHNKVLNVNTTGIITSANVVVHGYVQYGTAATASRVVIVERATGTPVMGLRPGSGVPVWVGPLHHTFRGLSCSVLSAGGTMTIYFD